jgi:hypothetical protein
VPDPIEFTKEELKLLIALAREDFENPLTPDEIIESIYSKLLHLARQERFNITS